MKKRLSVGFVLVAALSSAAACGGATVSLGDEGKTSMSLSDVKPASAPCPDGTQHPNVCCKGDACYVWVDDPFRPCEFGYESLSNGAQCCSPDKPEGCKPPAPPAPPEECNPDSPKACPPVPPSPPLPRSEIAFKASSFEIDRASSACKGGEQLIAHVAPYGWVGVELCSATRYKIYLGADPHGVFHEIGDFAGHGQDHCELVNPKFSIPNEDDITSGGCTDCNVEMAGWERPGAVPVYTRATFGEPFKLQTWPEHNLYTSSFYECGVAIGK